MVHDIKIKWKIISGNTIAILRKILIGIDKCLNFLLGGRFTGQNYQNVHSKIVRIGHSGETGMVKLALKSVSNYSSIRVDNTGPVLQGVAYKDGPEHVFPLSGRARIGCATLFW